VIVGSDEHQQTAASAFRTTIVMLTKAALRNFLLAFGCGAVVGYAAGRADFSLLQRFVLGGAIAIVATWIAYRMSTFPDAWEREYSRWRDKVP
jgi:hypothetical protein